MNILEVERMVIEQHYAIDKIEMSYFNLDRDRNDHHKPRVRQYRSFDDRPFILVTLSRGDENVTFTVSCKDIQEFGDIVAKLGSIFANT